MAIEPYADTTTFAFTASSVNFEIKAKTAGSLIIDYAINGLNFMGVMIYTIASSKNFLIPDSSFRIKNSRLFSALQNVLLIKVLL